MTFFPTDFDPRDDVIGVLDLCEIDTPDGIQRFMIGTDGIFTDTSGNAWVGSQLITVESLEQAINGVAPGGAVMLAFFQDPDAASLINEVKSLGLDYIKGRAIRFYVQPVRSMAEFYAPTTAPQLWLTRIMRTLEFSVQGPLQRSMSVTFESWAEDRRSARRLILNTEGHAILTGSANPSLEFMPTTDFTEEKLFG